MSEGQSKSREPVTLPRALLVSVAVHALLLLLLGLLPSSTSTPKADDEIAVRFDLAPTVPEAPPPDSDLFRPTNPVEERATEEPVNPLPSSLGAVEPQPIRPQPEPPVDPEPQLDDPADDPTDLEPVRPEEVERSEEEVSEGLDLPGDRPTVRQNDEPPPPEPLDLGRAIRDFRPTPRPAEPEPPEQQQPGTPTGVDLPDLERLPATGFGMDRNLMFESSDYDWSDYARQIYVAIWRAWHNRLWQTTAAFDRWAYEARSEFLEHQVLVQFTINRNGQVTEIFVVRESGCGPLDASATDALAEVVLPRLPDDFPRDRERVRARFIATGEIRGMKRTLEWMKSAGWF